MVEALAFIAKKLNPNQVPAVVRELLKDNTVSGKLIILFTGLALIAANSPLSSWYESFVHLPLSLSIGGNTFSFDLLHAVNEGLMAIFFLVVGLELKRELFKGDFRHLKTAILPAAAAIGGMVVPALIYLAITKGTDAVNGWAIPMATDIAIAIGVLALLGDRVPGSIRLFLLTLAVVDDIGAVLVIAFFYNQGIDAGMLLLAAAVAGILLIFHKSRYMTMATFVSLGLLIWLAILFSGVHVSVAGVIVGLLAPLAVPVDKKTPIAERLEYAMIPVSTLIVVPLFIFLNTGISLSPEGLQSGLALPIAGGIIIGLVAGKMIGIAGVTWLLVKLKLAEKPAGARWNHIVGVSLIAGIGFTVSIFVTNLAFTNEEHQIAAKLSIFAASIIAALLGLFVLRFMSRAKLV